MPPSAAELEYDLSCAPFFEGAARGELMLQRCEGCGTHMWPVKYRCINCFGGDVHWRAATGRATLYSLVLVHQPYPGFEVPYVLATIETVEGVRFNSTIVGPDPGATPIGADLMVEFDFAHIPFPVPTFRVVS
ncbi:Zn-ribbon domain-containing OB-fold protein [Nocardia jiangxiensis]|uniref:Zn-ribbon domain-containing OB-fold protein n=1 Tax=Nocardia jiangxiensis TaxID=282685 RepID=UPI000A04C7E0|nr:OB-fold domain-containing protein [Nocardia jiangxiensis]